jgi:hypothetical protein
MDHHGDWEHWSEEDPDTADLSGGHDDLSGFDAHATHDLGGHDDLSGHDELGGHDDLSGFDSHDAHDAFDPQGPDLVHEGADVPSHDAVDHDPADHDPVDHDAPDYAADHEPAGYDAHADHVLGADPDRPEGPDSTWHDGDFPPPLDLDARPEPSDGFPWADPDTLGDPDHGSDLAADPGHYGVAGTPPAGDLFAYAGMDAPAPGVDPWPQLVGSDDPATSNLARFWGPSGG